MDYDIKLEEREQQPVLCIRETVPAEIGDLVGRLIGEAAAALGPTGAQITGGPYARSIWQPGTSVEVGFYVAADVQGEGRATGDALPAGRFAVTIHTGPYDQLGPAYNAVRDWIAKEGLAIAGVPWEVYLSDPTETPDPSDWRTEVVFPVR
jgi:effector-binding domain-containing protein